MGYIHDIGQKIKGETQKVKGELDQDAGNSLKGTWEKVKGSYNSTVADEKLRAREDQSSSEEI